MKYQHIVFDVDGTLVDTEYSVLHSFRDVLETLTGKHYEPEELTFALGMPSEDALARFGLSLTTEVQILWGTQSKKYDRTNKLFEGMETVLETLKARGCSLGIVTSRNRLEFQEDIESFGITRLFDHVICADDTTEHKPKAAPLLKYMELAGARPEETIYVGDSIYDALCAQTAGVDFADAVWGSHTVDRPARYFPETPLEFLGMMK